MRLGSWLPRSLLLLPVLLLLGLECLPEHPGLDLLDAQLYSQFFRWRGPRPADARLRILAIDSDSLQLEQLLTPAEQHTQPLWRQMGPWPWPRRLQAQLAVQVLRSGARGVAFDIVYSQPSRYGPADDRAFEQLLRPWRSRLVFAAALHSQDLGGLEQQQLQGPIYGWVRRGVTNLLQDAQGRSVSLPGSDWLATELTGWATARPATLAAALTEPPAPAENLGIDFAGPEGTIPQIPAWQLPQTPAAEWRDRWVLIGGTAPELGDRHETPFGSSSGVEVQANALATLLQGSGHRSLPLAGRLLLLVGVSGLAGLGLRHSRQGLRTVSAGLLSAALLLGLGYLVWLWAHWQLPLAALVLLPLGIALPHGGSQLWREQSERRYLRDLLARRLSPVLLQEILRQPDRIWTQLQGQCCFCVVLFSDLQGFTTLSSELPADRLFTLTNRYFERMAAVILDQGGLIDKFIGDAVMAEFGVPQSRGNRAEALAAVRAAWAMQQQLEQLNRELATEGLPPLAHGIGLHCGEVMAGNLGSPKRLEYSVIGETVNLTSRIEALTRTLGHPILLSQTIVELVGDRVKVEPLGLHSLRGSPRPLELYALRGLGES